VIGFQAGETVAWGRRLRALRRHRLSRPHGGFEILEMSDTVRKLSGAQTDSHVIDEAAIVAA